MVTIPICSMYDIFTYILVIYWANVGKYSIPSSNQSWCAGKSTIEISDFPSYKPPFSLGIFQPCLMTRGYMEHMGYGTIHPKGISQSLGRIQLRSEHLSINLREFLPFAVKFDALSIQVSMKITRWLLVWLYYGHSI